MKTELPQILLEYRLIDGTTGVEFATGTVRFTADQREPVNLYGSTYVASRYAEWRPHDMAVLTDVNCYANFRRPDFSNKPTEHRPQQDEDNEAQGTESPPPRREQREGIQHDDRRALRPDV